MGRNSLSLVTIFGLLVASLCVSGEFGGRKSLAPAASITADLGFTPLDSKDSKAVELGRFAVDEYNKENKGSIVFENVLEAILFTSSDSVEQGSKYAVVVSASSDKTLDVYIANILVSKDNAPKLISFTKTQ